MNKRIRKLLNEPRRVDNKISWVKHQARRERQNPLRTSTARKIGWLDGHTERPLRSLDGWRGPEILAWLEGWRGRRAELMAEVR